MEYPIVLVMLIYICRPLLAAVCDEAGKDICCSGYKLNKTTQQCEKCPLGYTGMGCVYKCLYPFYGDGCFMNCDCSAEMCDFMSGCKYISTTVNPNTQYKRSRLTDSQEQSTWRFQNTTTEGQPLDESTKIEPISTSNVLLVFYTTVSLISVFVISFFIYGLSFLRKTFISRRNNKPNDLHFNVNGNAVYECVDFPHHM